MPVIYKRDGQDVLVGLWRVDESETQLREILSPSSQELEELEALKGGRRLEWLAVRCLLSSLRAKPVRELVTKDEHGKPGIQGGEYISFSHCLPLVGVAISASPVGIDVQKEVEQVYRIRTKFCSDAEIVYCQDRFPELHIIWGVKEAMYKAWGQRRIDFKRHLAVSPFRYTRGRRAIESSLTNDTHHWKFKSIYETWSDYYLVLSVLDSRHFVQE